MAVSRSKAEKALLRLTRDARLPLPETNLRFGRFEADFVWREQKVIVELDSPTFHGGPGAFQRSHAATAERSSCVRARRSHRR